MTNVLVPTDFTAASLKLAEAALKNENLQKCNLILFHAFGLPDLPIDLLMSGRKDPAGELMNEPFRQACKQLKDAYPSRIGKIVVRCLQGNTRAVFRNFVEANDIDLIYCPEDYVFVPVHNRSIDPCYFFQKSGVPVMKSIERKTENAFKAPAFDLQLSTS
jgi:hypothetical protein